MLNPFIARLCHTHQARSASAPCPESCLSQTHTPDVSARIAPPCISSPTTASRPSSRSVQTRSPLCPGGGPEQTAEVDHFIMPKSGGSLVARPHRFRRVSMALPSHTQLMLPLLQT